MEVATASFLRDGYAATSIENVARQARVGKRTLYARFADKETLFRAVLEGLMTRWLASPEPAPAVAPVDAALVQLAERMLDVALQPDALALHRLLVSEAGRFPHMLEMLRSAGTGEGAARVAAILSHEMKDGRLPAFDIGFATEQFMHLVLSGPRRRALGLGPPFDSAELALWARRSVAMFLHGCHGLTARHPGTPGH